MKKLHFKATINAPVAKVWENIISLEPYMDWTSAFMPGSMFEGGWNKGDKIKFFAKNEKGEAEGMSSEIAESKPYEFISIKHLGIIKNGKEDFDSEEVKKWVPSYENYTFVEKDGQTTFTVDMDAAEEIVADFEAMWPKALARLKEISEK